MSDDEIAKNTTHHLMRVRVHTRLFNRLRVIADNECEITGTYVSVSDLVRSALLNFLRTYEAPLRADQPALIVTEDATE